MITKINEQDFNTKVVKDAAAVVDFSATWCGPCRMLAPVLEEISEETDPEEVQLARIRRLLQKRGYDPAQTDYTARQKTVAFLRRKGYGMELIRRAMAEDVQIP